MLPLIFSDDACSFSETDILLNLLCLMEITTHICNRDEGLDSLPL